MEVEAAREVRARALGEGLAALFDLACAAGDDPDGWAGLPPDAAAQYVIGLHTVVADLHRDGKLERPWPEDEIYDVLLGRVLPLLAPCSWERTEGGALMTLEAPAHVVDPDGLAWKRAALATVEILGKAVHPGFAVRGYADGARRVLVDVRTRA